MPVFVGFLKNVLFLPKIGIKLIWIHFCFLAKINVVPPQKGAVYILHNTRGCPLLCHKFCIELALPISPEIMDGFWCSRYLNNRIEVSDMMRLFAGGPATPLVVKIWTKQPWVKIENLHNFDHNFVLSRGKIWLCYFIFFFALWFQDSKQKISSHFNQKWRCNNNFPKFWFHFESEKSTSCLHFCLKWLDNICVKSNNHNWKKL